MADRVGVGGKSNDTEDAKTSRVFVERVTGSLFVEL
jgi:hypothetical protein